MFDWLAIVDFSKIPVEHKAQKRALTGLLTVLETQVPVADVTQAQIDRPGAKYPKDMVVSPRRATCPADRHEHRTVESPMSPPLPTAEHHAQAEPSD